MSRRCQRSSVSGVTIVTTCLNTRRPSGCPRAASRRRSSSVSCNRWPPSCARRIRFSSTRYATISCCWRFSQPDTAATRKAKAEASITDAVYPCTLKAEGTQRIGRVIGHNGRYERASTLLTSNRPVDDRGKLLGDTAAVTALLDRLLHHAHVLKCGPKSWRTKVHTDLRTEDTSK